MRVNVVKAAKPVPTPRLCRRCSHGIQAGESYKWLQPRYGAKVFYCHQHSPRPSEMTSSDKLARLYEAQEGLMDDADAFVHSGLEGEDLKASIEQAIETAREVGDEYSESADKMEEYFPGSDIREKADACEEWASELESMQSEVEDKLGDLDETRPTDEDKAAALRDDIRTLIDDAVSSLSL